MSRNGLIEARFLAWSTTVKRSKGLSAKRVNGRMGGVIGTRLEPRAADRAPRSLTECAPVRYVKTSPEIIGLAVMLYVLKRAEFAPQHRLI